MKPVRFGALALALALASGPALAGPPYLTDDPVPTETGHWEIYAFTAAEGHRSTLDADAGFDFNYGPVEGIQLTVTLPLGFYHAPHDGWRAGTGDVEIGVNRGRKDGAHRPEIDGVRNVRNLVSLLRNQGAVLRHVGLGPLPTFPNRNYKSLWAFTEAVTAATFG